MKKERTRKNLPKPQAIAAHWQCRTDEIGVFHDWQHEVHANECFACGDRRRVARCHIVPHALGGSNEVDNLMLFCPRCHEESEHLPQDVFWRWIKNQRENVWDTPIDHQIRRMRSYGLEKMVEEQGIDVKTPEDAINFLRLVFSMRDRKTPQ